MDTIKRFLERLFGFAKKHSGLSVLAATATLLLLVLLALVGTSLISVRSGVLSQEYSSKRALYIAEAGLAMTRYTLNQDWNNKDNPSLFPTTPFAAGTYSVTITPTADPDKINAKITGRYANSARVLDVTISRAYPPYLGGALHANEDVNLKGNPTINGDVLYGDQYSEQGSVNVNGEVDQSDIPIPTLNIASAIAAAQSNTLNGFPGGNYFRGDFPSQPTSLNGVIYVDTFPDGSPAVAHISSNISTDNGQPAFLIVSGNIKITGTIDFDGLVYVLGGDIDVALGGTITIDGALYATGNVNMLGNAVITYVQDNIDDDMITNHLSGEEKPYVERWAEVPNI